MTASPTPNYGRGARRCRVDDRYGAKQRPHRDGQLRAAVRQRRTGRRCSGSDLIGYDALSSYGSPSYYAQVMFAEYKGDEVLSSSLEGAGPLLFYSVTKDTAKGLLYLKVINASPQPQALEIKVDGATVAGKGALTTLSAKTTSDTNSITDPKHIVPVSAPITGLGATIHHTFAPLSINVLVVPAK